MSEGWLVVDGRIPQEGVADGIARIRSPRMGIEGDEPHEEKISRVAHRSIHGVGSEGYGSVNSGGDRGSSTSLNTDADAQDITTHGIEDDDYLAFSLSDFNVTECEAFVCILISSMLVISYLYFIMHSGAPYTDKFS